MSFLFTNIRYPLPSPFRCPNSALSTHRSALSPPAFAGLIFSPWATRHKLLCPLCSLRFSRQLDPFHSPLSTVPPVLAPSPAASGEGQGVRA